MQYGSVLGKHRLFRAAIAVGLIVLLFSTKSMPVYSQVAPVVQAVPQTQVPSEPQSAVPVMQTESKVSEPAVSLAAASLKKIEVARFLSPLDSLAAQIKDPASLSKYMKKNFDYRSDSRLFGRDEFWQSAEEMAVGQVGDCEDYAIFARAMLERMGYQTFLLSVYWDTNAHTVTVFKTAEGWGYFDLDKLRTSKSASVADLAGDIHRNWEYAALMRQSGRQGVISRKYKDSLAEKTSIDSLLAVKLA